MKTAAHWADIAISIYDRIQQHTREVALIKDGDKVRTSFHGNERFDRVFRLFPEKIIGVYDHRATLDEIEADIIWMMR